jgi:hypothetical protein
MSALQPALPCATHGNLSCRHVNPVHVSIRRFKRTIREFGYLKFGKSAKHFQGIAPSEQMPRTANIGVNLTGLLLTDDRQFLKAGQTATSLQSGGEYC